ncbi:MAG: ATP-binding protein [Eggerthellaceae bacterium]
MESLYEYMENQLAHMRFDFKRYQYNRIDWNNRMLALVGPRGVGKTTLFLQRIRDTHSKGEALYVTADHLFFTTHTLVDAADAFYKHGGRYLFIDEVHKYPQWSRELKNIYDAYPNMHVYFTGSSVLDIEKGEADLSRRAPRYLMQGLSFREFLKIRYDIDAPILTLDQILENKVSIPEVDHPLPLFEEYLQSGYYPFGADPDFAMKLRQVITRTLEQDIPSYAQMNMSTGRKLLKLMVVISELVPFKPNISNLAKQIQISRNSVEDYLVYMEKAGMIALLRTGASGLGALGKPEKVFLDNPNILFNLCENCSAGTVRETFFFNQMRVNHLVTASKASDFTIGKCTFEVGGPGKGQAQIRDIENGYVIRDGIEYGCENVIPLWAFGLNY